MDVVKAHCMEGTLRNCVVFGCVWPGDEWKKPSYVYGQPGCAVLC